MVDGLNWPSSWPVAYWYFSRMWGSFRIPLPGVSFLIVQVSCFPWRSAAAELFELTRFASTGHKD